MRRICAWCGAELGAASASMDGFPISHGICEPCTREVEAQLPLPLHDYLGELDAPVLLVDAERRVGAATGSAEGAGAAAPARLGEVFECAHAVDHDCGLSIHCSGCVIRRSVEHTWTTGEALDRVPATLERMPDASPADVAMRVSTERVGERVLIRIETTD